VVEDSPTERISTKNAARGQNASRPSPQPAPFSLEDARQF
jgi:hypothetical protein